MSDLDPRGDPKFTLSLAVPIVAVVLGAIAFGKLSGKADETTRSLERMELSLDRRLLQIEERIGRGESRLDVTIGLVHEHNTILDNQGKTIGEVRQDIRELQRASSTRDP